MIRPSDAVLHLIIYGVSGIFVLAMLFAWLVLLVHIKRGRTENSQLLLEAAWEPVLLEALAAGVTSLPSELVRPAERLHFVRFLVRYARRLRGVEREALEAIAAPYLPEVRLRAVHRSPEVRARAILTLTTLGMPTYAEDVVNALDDSSPLVAMTAARGLAHKRHAQYAPDVLAHIERFGDWNHRFLSSMLSAIGESAAPSLRAIFADPTATVHSRSVAAHALAHLNDLESAEVAAAVLAETGTDRELVGSALTVLGAVGHAGHLAGVRQLLNSDQSWVRAQALETLARLGSSDDAASLVTALNDPSPWVALRAAYGLQEIGANDALMSLAAEETDRGRLSREVLSGGYS